MEGMKSTAVVKSIRVKRSRGERIFSVFNYIVLSLLTLICLYPVWHVVMGSLSGGNALMRHQGLLFLPAGFSTEAYARVAQDNTIVSGYRNTLFILIAGTSLDIVMTSLCAYFLSRERILFRKVITILIMLTMFFGGGMIPFYLTLKDLHLTGNLWGLIFPFMINTHNMIVMRTSFQSLPDSLIDAAQIDGAGHFTILFRIVLPLSKAILAVMVLYYGVSRWNSWFWAYAILRKREMYPLQVVLREILNTANAGNMAVGAEMGDAYVVAQTIKYAAVVVSTVPILCIYPFLQRYFTKGTMVGAVKE